MRRLAAILMWLLVIIPVLLFVAGADVSGEELDEIKNEVEKQREVIEKLEKRLKELETKEEAAGIEEKEKVAILPRFGINLGVFGDINFSTDSREKKNDSFSIGSLSVYSTANYGERLNFLFEMAVEQERGETDEDVETLVEVERLWAGYTWSDLFAVRVGRFHTPLGYWNTEFHHGKFLFLSIDSPFFLHFEDFGGVMPIHLVGLEVSGTTLTGAGRFRYDFEVGNGPRMVEDPVFPAMNTLTPNAFADDNDSKQMVLRLSLEPEGMQGMNIGIFGTNFRVEDSAGMVDVYESIYGLYLYCRRNPVEFVTEYFRLRNRTASADAYYIRFAYTLERFTPFLRYESLDSEKDDPYLSALSGGGDRFQYIAGVKYDLDVLHSSLKAQYRYDEKEGEKTYNVFEMQWAFRF